MRCSRPYAEFEAYAQHLEAASRGKNERSLVAAAAASLGSGSRKSAESRTAHTSGLDPVLGEKEVSISQLRRCSARIACDSLDWLVV